MDPIVDSIEEIEEKREIKPRTRVIPIPSSPDWPFPCIICGKRFEVPSHVGRHIEQTHMFTGPSMCDICGKIFKSPGGMQRHKRTHTGEKPYKCSYCSGTFAQWSTWRKHELTHLKSKEFQCFSCEAYFDQEKDLEDHTKSGPCNGRKFDCCGSVFQNRNELLEHQIKRHRRMETKLQSCKFCDKVFSLYTDKRIHEEAHIGKGLPDPISDDMAKCTKCHKYFGKNILNIHSKQCSKDSTNEIHRCDLCRRIFLSRHDMLQHRRSHNNASTSFPCTICNKILKSRASRYTHMMFHTAPKKHKCDYCEKGFIIRAHLVTHIRMHTGEKPFACSICGKTFAHNQSRRNHESTHIRPKSFKCNYCPKAFNSAQSRISHERFHTGEKPYQCKYCNQRFIRLGTLKCHERVHTGERPFACKICDKRFAQSSTLSSHMKTHTKDKDIRVPQKSQQRPTVQHPNPEMVQEEWVFDQTTGNQMFVVNNAQHHYY